MKKFTRIHVIYLMVTFFQQLETVHDKYSTSGQSNITQGRIATADGL